MYKRSASCSQPDLFSGFESHFKRRKQDQLNDPKSWHNLFYQHVTSKIDEDVFSVLFDPNQGRPNAPIRQLVSMMILKEGFGWSDAHLPVRLPAAQRGAGRSHADRTIRALSVQHPGDAGIGVDESMR